MGFGGCIHTCKDALARLDPVSYIKRLWKHAIFAAFEAIRRSCTSISYLEDSLRHAHIGLNVVQTLQGFRGKLLILEKRRLDLDAARRDYNRLEQKRVKKSENNLEPPAELIIQIQAKETALNGE